MNNRTPPAAFSDTLPAINDSLFGGTVEYVVMASA